MTQLILGRRDSTVITSFFFLVLFLGETFSHSSSESESVASSHVPFLGSCFFFLAPPSATKHMGGEGSGLSYLIAILVTSSSSEESSTFSSCSPSSSSSSEEIHSPT